MEKEKKLRYLRYLFWVAIIVSLGLTLSNYTNYLGLLESMNEVVFSIDEVTHRLDDSRVEFTISFSIVNPTSYEQLMFSSLQCQLYLIDKNQEHYLGATGYAPPVDVPLHQNEVRSYSTLLSVSVNELIQPDESPPTELNLRVRNVIHFSTPIRRFYQNININTQSQLT